MLVIARKTGERICLGDDVTITVLGVTGETVRLGIDAPPEIKVFRHEIYEQVSAENRKAAEASIDDLPTRGSS